MTNTSGCCHSL